MIYNPHPVEMFDPSRRGSVQQASRASVSYDHRHTPSTSYHHNELSSNHWNGQSAFSAPQLPPPRDMPTQSARYAFHESPSQWSSKVPKATAPMPSPRDKYIRERSFRTEADRFAAENDTRTRPHHHISEEPMKGQFAHAQPHPGYARPTEISPARSRNEVYEREQNRHADSQSAQPHPNTANRSRVESNSAAPVQRVSAQSYPRQHPELLRADHSLSHANGFGPQQEPQHDRRMSMQSVVNGSADSARYRHDPSAPTWPVAPPAQHIGKRSIPSDYDVEMDHRSSALPPRPHTSTSTQFRHISPVAAQIQMQPPVATTTARNHLQPEREIITTPVSPRRPLTAESSSSSHADFAMAAVAPSSHGIPMQPTGLSVASQHPLQPSRKRLRISRACDECRRRKTRCDIVGAFPGEPGHPLTISGAVPPLEPNMEPKGEMLILQPCMNCRRSEVTCSYSKRPLKRGPSKGYIKDLERRLNSLESQIVTGERAEVDAEKSTTESPATVASGTPVTTPAPAKPKVRTEDRISRLESVLKAPSIAKSENDDRDKSTSSVAGSSSRNSEIDESHIKSETLTDAQPNENLATTATAETTASQQAEPTVALPTVTSSVTVQRESSTDLTKSPAVSAASRHRSIFSKSANKARRRLAQSPSSVTSDVDVADVKAQVMGSCLHATFPVVPTRFEAEGSNNATSSSNNNKNIARLEDRVLARAMRLLIEPVEMVTLQQNSPAASSASQTSRTKTPQTHANRVANLIGQASAGLGGSRDELALQARPGTDQMRALRTISHRLSCQEADLLMLCHLDHLRNGRNNNSALAAAVSKLGSGSTIQNDRDTYRRRTLLFMLDRWHAVAFGTPHLLTGRFGVERHSFQSMKEALGDVSQSPLGDAVYEVLRCAIMLGQLNDLVQNNGGWKGISKSDVEAIIHSATDENERTTASESSTSDPAGLASSSSSNTSEASPDLLSTAALRYSLESTVRCYYALHTLPNSKDATVEDVHRIFTLAESILVLGTGKIPISLQGKLLHSAIGPHVLAIAGVAFSWCLRMICKMVAQSLTADATASTSAATAGVASETNGEGGPKSGGISPSSFPLEFYRRKILDYTRMCGPFCLFSGSPPTSPASFAPLYLRLALYFNQTVSFASRLGSLVSPQLEEKSPLQQDPTALGNEADNVLEMAKEMGFLGYVLAGTRQKEAWKLISGGARGVAEV